jgi:1-pyrroline-5-carboxylate dehydrogenase
MAVYANYLTYKLLEEAGLPKGVIQFIPVAGADVEPACKQVLFHSTQSHLQFHLGIIAHFNLTTTL